MNTGKPGALQLKTSAEEGWGVKEWGLALAPSRIPEVIPVI